MELPDNCVPKICVLSLILCIYVYLGPFQGKFEELMVRYMWKLCRFWSEKYGKKLLKWIFLRKKNIKKLSTLYIRRNRAVIILLLRSLYCCYCTLLILYKGEFTNDWGWRQWGVHEKMTQI